VLRADIKKTLNGKRAALVCTDEGEDTPGTFLLFLSPSYSDSKKFSAIDNLLKEKKGNLYVSCDDIKETEDYKIPSYSFHHE
jgi:hypothetical protein